nr:cation transporter [Brevundimonas denitrificans]
MTCATCPITVRRAMESVPGVNSVEVDFAARRPAPPTTRRAPRPRRSRPPRPMPAIPPASYKTRPRRQQDGLHRRQSSRPPAWGWDQATNAMHRVHPGLGLQPGKAARLQDQTALWLTRLTRRTGPTACCCGWG